MDEFKLFDQEKRHSSRIRGLLITLSNLSSKKNGMNEWQEEKIVENANNIFQKNELRIEGFEIPRYFIHFIDSVNCRTVQRIDQNELIKIVIDRLRQIDRFTKYNKFAV